MTTLANPRHERFAQSLFAGMTADAAYADAGYKPHRSNASRLSANDSVRIRLSELQTAVADDAIMTRTEALKELSRLARSDLRKAVKWQPNVTGMYEDEDGQERLAVTNQVQLVASDELDDDTAAAIAEISQTDKGGLKLKMHDKLGALGILARFHGIVGPERGEGGVTVNLGVGVQLVDAPRETREEWLARKVRERAEQLAPPSDGAA